MAQAEGGGSIISLPKGGGALHGIGEKFSPDLHTGTGNFTVPIAIPSGRNGFQPELNLVYSTGNGNGPFGLGWNLSIPGISRKSSKGVPRYEDQNDVYILSGAEDLVAISGSHPGRKRYRPRTEGLFALIEHQRDAGNDFWEVRSKDGLISTYGGTKGQVNNDAAVIADPARRDHVFAWKLTETRDRFGNLIEYQYRRDKRQEVQRDWDQLYLKQIRYADYRDNDGTTQFLVTVDFIYQDNPASENLDAVEPDDVRTDAFSEYRSGFEVRTRLRCKRIIVKTQAEVEQRIRTYELIYLDQRLKQAELDLTKLEEAVSFDPGNASLVARRDAAKSLRQELQSNLSLNGVSLLSQVEVTGHDGDETESLSPLEFRYTRFEPEKRNFSSLQGADLPARSLANPDLELVDLFGTGLLDLMEMNGTVRYWRNLGAGRFDFPRIMQDAPAGFSLSDAGVQFIDANGDGRADLLVTNASVSGYFPLRFGGHWDRNSFQRFPLAPSFNLEDPEVKLVDLDGDGVTDAIRSGSRLECFFNDPLMGWNKTRWVERQPLAVFPNVNFTDPRVKWADMSGDGLQDIALVYDGNVEYWPNLGHGNWAKRIHMENSPRFPFGYDPKRVLVGDVDGDGLADIVYVDDTNVTLWINQSGNRWSNPVTIKGTPPVSDTDAVRLVDMLGSGIAGVLWSRDRNGLSHDHMFFLDFTGGIKPYLLNQMDSHIGAVTRIEYAPSTRFFLKDQKHPEQRWKTTLPFPVQVVSRVEVLDYFSRGKLTTEYSYHDGYWDGGEREFRGFGMVEQRDTETFDEYGTTGLHGPEAVFARVDRQNFSPPTLSKTWFHQGPVGDAFGDWEEPDRSHQYWQGDPQLLKHTETVNEFLRSWPSSPEGRRIKRDALRVLRGSILRTELYAEDKTDRQERPYTVSESSYGLVEVEPPAVGDKRRRIFFPHLSSSRITQWERGNDPMTQLSFTRYTDEHDADKFDPFGRPLAQTQVACPRGWRAMDDRPSEPYLSTRTCTVYAAPVDPLIYIHNRSAKVTSYEILTTSGKRVMEIAAIKDSSTDLKLIGQSLSFYDGPAFIGLALGQVGKFGAATRSESLVLTDEILQQAYGAEIPPYLEPTGNPAWTADYPPEFRTLLPRRAGYAFHAGSADPADPKGYFANTERRRYDFQTTPAGSVRGMVLETLDQLHDAADNPLAHRTLIVYDKYQFLPEIVTDAAGLAVRATNDYRVLQPREVTDPNGNRKLQTFSPLGLLESTFVRGKSSTEGDQSRPCVTREYGFLAFENSPPENRQPIFVRTISHIHHDTESDVPLPERNETIITVEYSDGFGRLLQTRGQGEEIRFGHEEFGGGEAVLPLKQSDGAGGDLVGRRTIDNTKPNVLVSGWQIFDNKGHVVEKYEPFFSEGWDYGRAEDSEIGQKVSMFYDPRGQTIRTLNPDGSEQLVIYGVPGAITLPNLTNPEIFEPTPWEAYTYDANDNAGRTHPAQSAPYQHHWNTPASIQIDALSRTIAAVERNRDPPVDPGGALPPVQELITRTAYDMRGNVVKITDELGREAFHDVYDHANGKLRTNSIDAGSRKLVLDANGGVIEERDSKGALILHSFDDLTRPLRLWARDRQGQNLTLRERLEYGDGGTPNQPDADRATNRAANRLGKLVRYFDGAGLLSFEAYDFRGNLREKTRRVVSDASILSVFGAPPLSILEAFRVDWTSPTAGVLDAMTFASTVLYDALNRVKLMTYPVDVESKRRRIRPHYNRAGSLERVDLEQVAPDGGIVSDTFIERIAYNAKGQRVLVAYGNGIVTRYAYDPKTFRLVRLRTERYTRPSELLYRHVGEPLQDLAYNFDLRGNMLGCHDRTPGCGVMNTPDGIDSLDRLFLYDALYRLRSGTGRECDLPPNPPWENAPRCTDLTKTRRYTQQYAYDLAGNLKELKHSSNGSGINRFFTLAAGNNRLLNVTVGLTPSNFEFDGNGNMTAENSSRHFEWDYANRMRVYRTQTGVSEPSVFVHYLYDGVGQRVKKLVRKQSGQVEVTTYIDGIFEYQRIVRAGVVEQNNTLHVMDNKRRVALVRVGLPFAGDTTPSLKYHLGDHLGSSTLVLDDTGNLINREEYTPFGETSFGSFARKRYRFTGTERDDESGLDYFGSRYYSSWLGRWITCDPIGVRGGLNLYAYVRGNPVMWLDPTGLAPENDNICTPAMRPVSPSDQNYAASKPAATDQTPAKTDPKPTPKVDPSSDAPPPRRTSNDSSGPASTTQVTKPDKPEVGTQPPVDFSLGPLVTPRRDPPPKDDKGGGWGKWVVGGLGLGFGLFGVGVAAVILNSAPPAVGVGVAAPAAALTPASPPPPPPVTPNGWHSVGRRYGPSLIRQSQFSGKPIIMNGSAATIEEYSLDDVDFDRFENGVLGEVKDDFSFMERLDYPDLKERVAALQREAGRQVSVATKHKLPLEWHVRQKDLASFQHAIGSKYPSIKLVPY